MKVYYAAVADDPLTGPQGGYAIASMGWGDVQGDDGRYRRLVFIGDQAYCATCESIGEITYGVTIRPGGRLTFGVKEQAVGGDLVLCNCPESPRIEARYGRNWKIEDDSGTAPNAPGESLSRVTNVNHWVVFNLSGREKCESLSCIARFEDGTIEQGEIDAANRVRFERGNGTACESFEIVCEPSGADSLGVSALLLQQSGVL